jgi:hypothetical protein
MRKVSDPVSEWMNEVTQWECELEQNDRVTYTSNECA